MIAYFVRRFLLALFTIWIISILSFLIIQLPPGDSVDKFLEQGASRGGGSVTSQQAENIRSYLGLDKPMHVRYAKWMWNLLHGHPGFSFGQLWDGAYHVQLPVMEVIGERLALTVVLTFFTILFTWTFAIPVGIY